MVWKGRPKAHVGLMQLQAYSIARNSSSSLIPGVLWWKSGRLSPKRMLVRRLK